MLNNKIPFKILSKVNEVFGEFEIGQVWGGNNDVYLRFGYWKNVDATKLQETIGHYAKVVEEEYFDDDCGWHFSYHLK